MWVGIVLESRLNEHANRQRPPFSGVNTGTRHTSIDGTCVFSNTIFFL